MIRNYIKTAFRNLLKNSTFSMINVFGLSVGMSVCLVVIMLIKDAYSFDKFHPNGDRIYRVNTVALRKSGGTESYASSPMPVGAMLREQCPKIEESVQLVRTLGGEAVVGDKRIRVGGLFTDKAFFDMFGFELAEGNPQTVLQAPYSLVLTQETAEKFFGKSEPIGQTMTIGNGNIYKVTGVLKPFPGKTHLEFDALGSLSTIPALERSGNSRPLANDWNNYYFTYNYIRLQPGAKPAEVNVALDKIAQEQYADLELESRDKGYQFRLQPLHKITPGPILSNNMGRGLPSFVLKFLSVLGLIVLISACFNYTNLTVARAFSRTKEIGVRKVTGASRMQVAGQFLSESVIVSLIALGLGYLLMKLLVPALQSLEFMSFIDFSVHEDWSVYAWFVAFAIATGLVAGLLPALILSRIRPILVFQRLENLKLMRGGGLRKVFIVVQFALSLVFVFMITVVYQQTRFALTRDYGFHWDGVINIPLQGESYTALSQEFSKLNFVQSVSGASHNMGTWEDRSDDVRKTTADEPVGVRDYFVDENFLKTFDLKLVAGENFAPNPTQSRESYVLVNQKFLQQFKMGEPGDAIGQTLILGDSTKVAIRGVVKDFNFKPIDYALEPMLLRYDPNEFGVLNVKVIGSNLPNAVAGLQQTWNKVVDNHAFQYEFFDDIIKDTYSMFRDILRLLGFFAFLALTIACLGMLGMAVYTIETKAKEVSIRKVFGAGFNDLFILLSKGFMWLLLIALVVAIPAGYALGKLFLQGFNYRISLTAWVFLPGILAVGLLALLIVSSQVIRAAVANPIETLREE